MTPARSLLVAIVAVALLIGARPMADDEQFPRGLMSAQPRGGGGGICRIETRPLSFPAFDPLAETDVDAIGQVIYACGSNGGGGGPPDGRGGGPPDGRGGAPGAGTRTAQTTGIRIEMDEGVHGSFQPRAMLGGAGFYYLSYNIYLDPTHRTVWGTGAGSTEVHLDLNPPLDTPVTVLMYGRIFGRQDVPAGQYGDNVGVRIVF